MKKALLLTGALLALTVSIASAAGLSLAWVNPADLGLNTCPSSLQSLMDFNNACTSNSGSQTMIGSIVSPGLLNVVGEQIIIDMQESPGGVALSSWWDFSDLACRGLSGVQTSSLSLNVAFDPNNDEGLCLNLWQLSGSGATSYGGNMDTHLLPAPGRAHITGAFSVVNGGAWPAGTEWYSFRLSVNRAHTVAPQTICAGCQNPACFTFQYGELNQPAGTPGGTARLENPAGKGQSVSYRGGGALNCASATPTRRATWGQVKSLYR
jgi:hypothetical protein